jgi:hypothetical protein
MSAPDRLQRALGEEEPIASTRLGGEDALVVTPTRSILYRAGGVLSEESIAEFAHDAERIAVSESRRKATITLEYGLEGSDSFTVPTDKLEAVLKSLLAVNLSATGAITAEETVQAVFFFDELTLVITDAQVLKHVGSAVWDEEYESIPFSEVTGLAFESGRVNTQVVLESGTTADRIKTPQDRARAVRETLQDALCQFHEVESVEELEETLAAAAPERESRDSVDAITLGEDFDLLSRDDGGASANATYESDGDTRDDTLDGLYDDRPEGGERTETSATAETGVSADETERSGDEAGGDSDENGEDPPGTGDPNVARATRVEDRETPAPQASDDSERESEVDDATDAADAEAADRSQKGPDEQTAGAGRVTAASRASESDVDVEALAAHVGDLAAVIDRQAELLEEQRRTLEELLATIEERDP